MQFYNFKCSVLEWTNISFSFVDGSLSEEGPRLVMKEVSNITADATFEIPSLYSRCLKETLSETVSLAQHLYTGSYQDEAVAWVSKDLSDGDNCANREYLIERYALVATSFAQEGASPWINSNDHCLWNRVECTDGRVVQYIYGKEMQFCLVDCI